MSLLTYVVDTNIVVAGLITRSPESPVVRVLDSMLTGELLFYLSPDLLDEYRTVLLRPKLMSRHGLSESEIDLLLVDIAANALWVEPADGPAAPDRGDDHLWSLLSLQPGTALITGDHLLLADATAEFLVLTADAWLRRENG
ncbi:MAG: putative toxin-antitoxin system toxin component, PIN family [Pseudomonadota bacterium]